MDVLAKLSSLPYMNIYDEEIPFPQKVSKKRRKRTFSGKRHQLALDLIAINDEYEGI